MNFRALTVTAHTDLAGAVRLMTDNAVKSLPVVDESHRVVAVISRRDIVRVLARADERIEYEVDDLFRDLGVDWLVDVVDGAATVTGPVGPHESNLAKSAAATVPGVVRVTVVPETWLGSRPEHGASARDAGPAREPGTPGRRSLSGVPRQGRTGADSRRHHRVRRVHAVRLPARSCVRGAGCCSSSAAPGPR